MMLNNSLVKSYENFRKQPTAAKELILDVGKVTGRKESAIRKWLDGSTIPDEHIRSLIEEEMNMSIDSLVNEYYRRLKLPSPALYFRQRIAKATHKSSITVMRYVRGLSKPDELAKDAISKEFNTPISILFP